MESEEKNIHTEEDVRLILDLATIKESELNGVTQCLYSMQDHKINDVMLLEVDQHILEALNEGDTVSFRGNKCDNAVLCTKNRTYEVKEAEISNSWLLVPDLKLGKATHMEEITERTIERRDIRKILSSYYEVEEIKPILLKLSTLLIPSSFNGLEYESTIDPKTLYNWERLRDELQASDDELKQALEDLLIIHINGYLRLVSLDVEVRSLHFMLEYFVEQFCEIDEINKESTYDCLKELIFEPVFDVLFEKYTSISNKTKDNGDPLYRYNAKKCCVTMAKVLLASSPTTEYKIFMETWITGIPEKMQPKEEYLRGLALVTYNFSTMQKEVVSCPEMDLPDNIDDRLKELFQIKEKWTAEEITPYIVRFTKSTMNANALLTKYARCSTKSGIKYYGSKFVQ